MDLRLLLAKNSSPLKHRTCLPHYAPKWDAGIRIKRNSSSLSTFVHFWLTLTPPLSTSSVDNPGKKQLATQSRELTPRKWSCKLKNLELNNFKVLLKNTIRALADSWMLCQVRGLVQRYYMKAKIQLLVSHREKEINSLYQWLSFADFRFIGFVSTKEMNVYLAEL